MREILFRAKRKDNGEWVEGAYFCLHHNDERKHLHHFIIPDNADIPKDKTIGEIQVEVIPETLSQYTGLTDKKGSRIWENDIVQRTDLHISTEPNKGIIWYDTNNTAFLIKWLNPVKYSATYPWKDNVEVIGNVFDNADWLKG